MEGVNFMTTKFKVGWDSVQSVHLKSQESVALPIFNQLPVAADAPGTTPKRKRSDSLDTSSPAKSPKARKTAEEDTATGKSPKSAKSRTPKRKR